MSISEQKVELGQGFSISPMFSIYSASMVGVFCALILIMDAPLAVICALAGLLFCYLLTCIFVFGSFRGILGETEPLKPAVLRANFPGSMAVLFGLATLGALFGTYSALDPIAGAPTYHSAGAAPGGVTHRVKQSDGSAAHDVSQSDADQTVSKQASKTDSREAVPVAAVNFDRPKAILAAARTDDLVGTREFRSHAWAVRETANLPAFLTLPKILFSILYGDETPVETIPDMVFAKQSSGGAARIMVSFLTTPQSSFKNHPAPKAGGYMVVQKRETVIAMQPPSAPPEPVTVVAKAAQAPAPVLVEGDAAPANTTVVVARLEPAETRQDPVAVTSTKQDLEEITRTTATPLKPTAARTPQILLPPVLASIFYGRPNSAEPTKAIRRSPRLTTLTKTTGRQTVKLVDPDPVTVVAKSAPPAQRQRHPIALAALADTHRISQDASDGLGGPFSVALDAAPQARQGRQETQSEAEASLITGSISPGQINSAIRSLRFVPQFKKRQVQQATSSPQVQEPEERGAKSDLGPVASRELRAAPAVAGPVGSRASGTVILKQDAAAAHQPSKIKLASLPDDLRPAEAAQPRSKKQNARRVAPAPKPAAGTASERGKVPTKKSPLSEDALREANEEINSALRGAEADLEDTDQLLDEIDVIWSDHDKAAQRRKKGPDTKALIAPKLVPVSSRKGHVIIQPASHSRSGGTADARDVVQLPVLPERAGHSSREQRQKNTAAATQHKVSTQPARQEPRQLLGYISEKGSLKNNSRFVDCAVVGSDAKLRNCAKRRAL